MVRGTGPPDLEVTMPLRRIVLAALLVPSLAFGADTDDEAPWRIDTAAGLPSWLSIGGQHRTRFENLDNQFRLGRPGGDQMLAFRTNVLAKVTFDSVRFAGEMLDSEGLLMDSGSPTSTNEVNPFDILQLWVELPVKDLFQAGS